MKIKRKQTSVSHVAISISLITFIVYLSSLRNKFVEWDDIHYVVQNPHIRAFDISFFKWAFLDFYVANWHPLTWLSHGLDYAVWGLNPLGHHLTNVILHAVNTFLVVILVARLIKAAGKFSGFVIPATPYSIRGRRESFQNTLKDSGQVPTYRDPEQIGAGMTEKKHSSSLTIHDSRFTLIAALTTGALFGLHPLHVESVAWVSERKDLLCAMFFLLSIMMYVEYAGSITPPSPSYLKRGWQSRGRYLLALFFLILALLSKSMAVSLPLVLLVLDWYPFKRISSTATFWLEFVWKLPFIILSLVSSLLTLYAQKSGSALTSLRTAPLSSRMLVSAKSLIAYLWKMILPLDLSPYYPYPKEVSFFSLEYLFPVALVIGITLTSIVIAKKQRLWLAAWCYYVATLIPVIGIVKVGTQSMADRYTYLPSLGPFLLLGLVAAWSWGKMKAKEGWGFALKTGMGAVAICAFVFLSSDTLKQVGVWKDNYSLWSYVVEKEADKDYMPYMNLGVEFFRMGRLDRAKENLEKAIALDPLADDAYMNLGLVYGRMGQLDRAKENLEKSISLYPGSGDAYMNLGIVYGKMGNFQEAKKNFERAVALNPTSGDAYYNLGILYNDFGLYRDAIDCFDKVLLLDQRNGAAYFGRGSLYLRTGDRNRAIPDFRKACFFENQDGCNALLSLGIGK